MYYALRDIKHCKLILFTHCCYVHVYYPYSQSVYHLLRLSTSPSCWGHISSSHAASTDQPAATVSTVSAVATPATEQSVQCTLAATQVQVKHFYPVNHSIHLYTNM